MRHFIRKGLIYINTYIFSSSTIKGLNQPFHIQKLVEGGFIHCESFLSLIIYTEILKCFVMD